MTRPSPRVLLGSKDELLLSIKLSLLQTLDEFRLWSMLDKGRWLTPPI